MLLAEESFSCGEVFFVGIFLHTEYTTLGGMDRPSFPLAFGPDRISVFGYPPEGLGKEAAEIEPR
jgi:hypothetical protein